RDKLVTGVQTCALPISYHGSKIFAEAGAQRQLRTIASLFPEAAHLVVRADSPIHKLADLKGKRVSLGESGSGTAADAVVFLSTRSEERRVGKGCRSRWV